MVSAAIRASVWDKCEGRCYYCGDALNPWREFQVDHRIPRSWGGTDEPENLVGSCKTCNLGKGARAVLNEGVFVGKGQVIEEHLDSRYRYRLEGLFHTGGVVAFADSLDVLVDEWSRNGFLPAHCFIGDLREREVVWRSTQSLAMAPPFCPEASWFSSWLAYEAACEAFEEQVIEGWEAQLLFDSSALDGGTSDSLAAKKGNDGPVETSPLWPLTLVLADVAKSVEENEQARAKSQGTHGPFGWASPKPSDITISVSYDDDPSRAGDALLAVLSQPTPMPED